jgi:hypothetical protein
MIWRPDAPRKSRGIGLPNVLCLGVHGFFAVHLRFASANLRTERLGITEESASLLYSLVVKHFLGQDKATDLRVHISHNQQYRRDRTDAPILRDFA